MGIRGVSPEDEKESYGGKDLQKGKVLSREWKSGWVMDDESGQVSRWNQYWENIEQYASHTVPAASTTICSITEL